MSRRKVTVRDAGEILEHWQAGRSIRAIAGSLGASRPTIRKYIAIAEAHGFSSGDPPPPEGWRAFLEKGAAGIFNPALGSVILDELCSRHEAIKEILEHTSVMTAWLRLREGLGLKASYSSFYRYVWKYLPDVLERTSITVRRDDPPPGEEAQVDFGYPGLWQDLAEIALTLPVLGPMPSATPPTAPSRTSWRRGSTVGPCGADGHCGSISARATGLPPSPIRGRYIVGNVHHLASKLKALKLGGMLDTLDLRLRQAQQEHLGYTPFLEMLLEDEVQRRANKKLAARVAQARFEEVKTFEGFDFAFNPKIPARQIMGLATCQFVERKEWAVFVGPVGVGKSHLIQALGHQACRIDHRVLYIKASRLLADLGGGHADGTWEARLRRYLKPDLLIVDDFATKEFTLQQAEDIYELIDERSRSGSLVMASNRSPQDWYPLFPNLILAEGVLDRLINKAHHVVLTGKSYRPQMRPDRLGEVAKEVRIM